MPVIKTWRIKYNFECLQARTDDIEEEVPEAEKERLIKQVMKERHESLGPMTAHELSVFVCFVTVIILWFFRRPLFMPGTYLFWSIWLFHP